jgi:hypothetical protein
VKHFLFKTKGGAVFITILVIIVLVCGGNALVAPPGKLPAPNPSSSVKVPSKPVPSISGRK